MEEYSFPFFASGNKIIVTLANVKACKSGGIVDQSYITGCQVTHDLAAGLKEVLLPFKYRSLWRSCKIMRERF